LGEPVADRALGVWVALGVLQGGEAVESSVTSWRSAGHGGVLRRIRRPIMAAECVAAEWLRANISVTLEPGAGVKQMPRLANTREGVAGEIGIFFLRSVVSRSSRRNSASTIPDGITRPPSEGRRGCGTAPRNPRRR
jgi:hypothetical protein